MIWFWRLLVLFTILNLINIFAVDGGAGTEPVWVLILIGSLILSFRKGYDFFFAFKAFKVLVIASLSFFIGVEALIISNGLFSTPPEKVDYVIVLGARVRGSVPSLELRNRLDQALAYLNAHPETHVIVTGGQGPGEDITEADAMATYLISNGISAERILLEDKATNTLENLTYSFEMMRQHDTEDSQQPSVLVVTSRFHILRSKLIASKLNHTVSAIGSPTLSFLVPSYYLREFFAVVAEALF